MELNSTIKDLLSEKTLGFLVKLEQSYGETTITCPVEHVLELLSLLKNGSAFKCDMLIDVCGVDYLSYGQSEWETDFSDGSSYSRGVEKQVDYQATVHAPTRFAVVYHLLSTELNHRCRVKVHLDNQIPTVPTATFLWSAANWFEREAYDLYGILFEGHSDLRRLLTDYGFIGHPFRKDFPLSGHVEMRYDATLERVVYEPVDIEPRVLVPKVIREDNRYLGDKEGH